MALEARADFTLGVQRLLGYACKPGRNKGSLTQVPTSPLLGAVPTLLLTLKGRLAVVVRLFPSSARSHANPAESANWSLRFLKKRWFPAPVPSAGNAHQTQLAASISVFPGHRTSMDSGIAGAFGNLTARQPNPTDSCCLTRTNTQKTKIKQKSKQASKHASKTNCKPPGRLFLLQSIRGSAGIGSSAWSHLTHPPLALCANSQNVWRRASILLSATLRSLAPAQDPTSCFLKIVKPTNSLRPDRDPTV